MFNKRKKYATLAFSQKAPTAFILGTPTQLLCAVEAIQEFNISDYLIVAIISISSERGKTLLEMIQNFNLNYQQIVLTKELEEQIVIGKIEAKANKTFPRVMVGNYFSHPERYLASIYASDDSVLVYFDDGNSTISILNGVESYLDYEKPKQWYKRKEWSRDYKSYLDIRNNIRNQWDLSGLYDGHYIYTFFYLNKSSKFIIYPNKFTHLASTISTANSSPNGIYIIGTVGTIGMREYEYEGVIWHFLAKIRYLYPQEKIYYIPHPADNNSVIPHFCALLGISYFKPFIPIEYYFIKNSIQPKVVYGFNSTALAFLKNLFPETEITDISLIRKHFSQDRIGKMIPRYYKQIGIHIQPVYLPEKITPTYKKIKDFIRTLPLVNVLITKIKSSRFYEP